MSTPPQPSGEVKVSFTPLGNNAAILLDLDGHKVLAVRIARNVAKEISGQEPESMGGILSKLKAKLGLSAEEDRWFAVANVDNPFLEQPDKFGSLVAQALTDATGTAVPKSTLTVSASVPIGEKLESVQTIQ